MDDMADARHSGKELMKFSPPRERERGKIQRGKIELGILGFRGAKVEEMQQSSAAPFNRKSIVGVSLMSSCCYVGDPSEVSTCWKTMERRRIQSRSRLGLKGRKGGEKQVQFLTRSSANRSS